MLPVSVLVMASVVRAASVRGGEEISLEASREIQHARAATGVVVAWSGRSVRWRAPRVCAPAQVDVIAQEEGGREEALAVEILPEARPGDVAIVPTGDGWDVQATGEDLEIRVSPEPVGAVRREGRCARASWSLSQTRSPSLAIAAAFTRGELAGWAVLRRDGAAVVVVEANAGASVTVLVQGRRFVARAGSDDFARVPIAVPPGVRTARVIGHALSQTLDLSPPEPSMEHRIVTDDGATWLFRTDEVGAPRDGPQPEGAAPIAAGVWRIPPKPSASARPPADIDPAAVAVAHWAETTLEQRGAPAAFAAREVSARESNAQRLARRGGWRSGLSIAWTGRGQSGALAGLERRWRGPGPLAWRAGAQALGGFSNHVLESSSQPLRRSALGILAWGGVSFPFAVASLRVDPSLSGGAAGGWRRLGAEAEQPIDRWIGTPAAKIALSVGAGALDMEAGLIGGVVPVGVQSSRILVTVGAGWTWSP